MNILDLARAETYLNRNPRPAHEVVIFALVLIPDLNVQTLTFDNLDNGLPRLTKHRIDSFLHSLTSELFRSNGEDNIGIGLAASKQTNVTLHEIFGLNNCDPQYPLWFWTFKNL